MAAQFYCHTCAAGRGYLANVFTSGLLQSTYQLEKYMKHTLPSSLSTSGAVQTFFSNPSTSEYETHVVDAINSGAVKIHGKRRNFIFAAGRQTGWSCTYGVFAGPTDGVLVVLTSEPMHIHAFPVATTTSGACADCGRPVPTDIDLIPPSGVTV